MGSRSCISLSLHWVTRQIDEQSNANCELWVIRYIRMLFERLRSYEMPLNFVSFIHTHTHKCIWLCIRMILKILEIALSLSLSLAQTLSCSLCRPPSLCISNTQNDLSRETKKRERRAREQVIKYYVYAACLPYCGQRTPYLLGLRSSLAVCVRVCVTVCVGVGNPMQLYNN